MAGNNAFLASFLKPGDVLLYKPTSIYGWIIRVKTWHSVSHVEIYLGNGKSSASRDGIGVNIYPLRLDGLTCVMRPKQAFDTQKATAFTKSHAGTPYGWLDLLNFTGLRIHTKGIVCSPWVTEVLRNNNIPIFNDEDSDLIAPFQFLDSELLSIVWKDF